MEEMEKIATDFKRLLPVFQRLGVKLADWNGEGDYDDVIANNEMIRFNGSKHCGHDVGTELTQVQIKRIISDNSSSSSSSNDDDDNNNNNDDDDCVDIETYITRSCEGDCSHETFYFGRHKYDDYNGYRTDLHWCKTARKPYDIAVMCALIIAKYHLGSNIKLLTDGSTNEWKDAEAICNHYLGYNISVTITNGKAREVVIKQRT
jgi:hypothetical protein